MPTMNFILQGRDQLSRVLDRAGDSANRLHRRISAATTNSSNSINRFVTDATTRMAALGDSSNESGEAFDALKKTALSLAPAIIPVAAAMAPLVASTAAAGVAVGVYTAALGPQIAAMGEAGKAEEKYEDAVAESGKQSKEAVKAHEAYRRAVEKLPPATRQAAAQLSVLKDEYKDWSNSLAKDTMGPVTKGLAIFSGLLPKLTPLVKGTSSELDRMMTILAGGMASPGFDKVILKFTDFSTGVLRRANDAIVNFTRTLNTGKVGGGISDFLDYARAQGPLVGQVLRNIGQALANLLRAGSEVGVGMLQAVNALAKLVAAVPPSVIAVLLQLAIALKAVKLAAIGLAAAKGAIAAFGAQIIAMRAAAAGAPGRLAAVGAAIGALSKAAKIAMAGTAIGLLVIAIGMLATRGKDTAPDVDKLTTSLGKLGDTGKVTGEAARVFGKDLSGLSDSLKGLTDPSNFDKYESFMSGLVGMDSGNVRNWKKDIDGVDQALANLVGSGHSDLAKAALTNMTASMVEQGHSAGDLEGKLDGYKQALANQAFEAKLAADAMGLFGAQAQSVQAKLNAQKQSSDGLRQSINALNDANLIARGGMRGMEAAIDAASAAAKENGRTLDINTEKGRNNQAALDTLADTTMRAAESARDNGASWQTVNGIYDRGRSKLIQVAQQMGLNQVQAKKLADQILRTPDKTARLRGNIEDLQRKLDSAKAQLRTVPDSRKAQVRASITQLTAALREARLKLTSIDGTTAHTYIYTHHIVTSTGEARKRKPKPGHYAEGGLVGFPVGGHVRGPGTGTSDSILAMLSNGEFVIPAKRVDQYGLGLFEAIRDGRFGRAAQVGGKAAMAPMPGRPAAGGRPVQPVHVQIDVSGAIDPVATAKHIQKALLNLKRMGGVNINLGVA